jgi:hypothetical protein
MSDTPFSIPGSYSTHLSNHWVKENLFISQPQEFPKIPPFAEARENLPDPFWAGHKNTIDCYWRAWELAFSNLKQPTPKNNFASGFCDTAFNGNLFMWDSGFTCCFGLYGRRAFNFQKTIDTFYRKQHPDGFICRELSEVDGRDLFERFDPSSTGPNVLAWSEWNHYLITADRERLERVFPPLVAYHQWLREYRTWQDGTYWTSGWGCGMDNMPRARCNSDQTLDPDDLYRAWGHGHLSWVDATFQAVLSAKVLLKIAELLGEQDKLADFHIEIDRLEAFANQHLWDENTAFYYDRMDSGELTNVKHIGAFWSLLAGSVPENRMGSLVSHLENPAEFNRTHRVPSLSADDPEYSPMGEYWCGGVWAPTNYMVLKGLNLAGNGDLAHDIAINHLGQVVSVYEMEDTPWKGAGQFQKFFHLTDLSYDDHHTLWENYAPDSIAPGNHSKPGYVGWTGLPPIAVLFEDVFGLVPDAPANRLVWTVRLLEEHGIRRYPFGLNGTLDLKCSSRRDSSEKPDIEILSDVPLTVEVIWKGGREILNVPAQP